MEEEFLRFKKDFFIFLGLEKSNGEYNFEIKGNHTYLSSSNNKDSKTLAVDKGLDLFIYGIFNLDKILFGIPYVIQSSSSLFLNNPFIFNKIPADIDISVNYRNFFKAVEAVLKDKNCQKVTLKDSETGETIFDTSVFWELLDDLKNKKFQRYLNCLLANLDKEQECKKLEGSISVLIAKYSKFIRLWREGRVKLDFYITKEFNGEIVGINIELFPEGKGIGILQVAEDYKNGVSYSENPKIGEFSYVLIGNKKVFVMNYKQLLVFYSFSLINELGVEINGLNQKNKFFVRLNTILKLIEQIKNENVTFKDLINLIDKLLLYYKGNQIGIVEKVLRLWGEKISISYTKSKFEKLKQIIINTSFSNWEKKIIILSIIDPILSQKLVKYFLNQDLNSKIVIDKIFQTLFKYNPLLSKKLIKEIREEKDLFNEIYSLFHRYKRFASLKQYLIKIVYQIDIIKTLNLESPFILRDFSKIENKYYFILDKMKEIYFYNLGKILSYESKKIKRSYRKYSNKKLENFIYSQIDIFISQLIYYSLGDLANLDGILLFLGKINEEIEIVFKKIESFNTLEVDFYKKKFLKHLLYNILVFIHKIIISNYKVNEIYFISLNFYFNFYLNEIYKKRV